MERILVIDDDEPFRRLVLMALEARGFVALESSLCKEGIQAALTHLPDIIVCDVTMPDGSGYDVFEALRGNAATSAIPFIFMTGIDDPAEFRRGMEQGADDFLVKPFHIESLFATVETRLRRGAALRAQAEQIKFRLQAIVEATPSLVSVADVQSRHLLYVNRAGRRMLGLTETEDISALRLGDIHPGWVLKRLDAEMISTALQTSMWAGEAALLNRNGVEIPVSQVFLAHKSPDGQVEFLSMIADDMTEQKAAQKHRQQMELQLRQAQKLESIGQLAAGIAHEINTPTQFIGDNIRFLQDAFNDLNLLLGLFTNLLEAARAGGLNLPLAAEIDKAIAKIDLPDLQEQIPQAITQSLSGVQRVCKIVLAMKDFSHPGTEKKVPIDINRAIESTITVCRNEWKYVAVLDTDFDPNLPPVSCLPGEFNQVILNVVVNAAHAIGDHTGGNIKGTIGIITRRKGDSVEIRISDTGTGIPEAIRGRIFDPFFTTKEVGRGTGQGLAIARSVVVDRHGGEMSFETEMGKGTTFLIQIPLHEPPANGKSDHDKKAHSLC